MGVLLLYKVEYVFRLYTRILYKEEEEEEEKKERNWLCARQFGTQFGCEMAVAVAAE